VKYEADHALQVAIEMERLGQTFYESLASGCGDAGIATLATRLAKDEERHIAVFTSMWNALPPVHRGPMLTEQECFAAAKELRVKIMPDAGMVREVALSADLRKALDMAIGMEVAAVAYYTGLVSGRAGLDGAVLTGIANEEKKHLSMLQENRKRLFPQATNP
jgi:rubrerythrin